MKIAFISISGNVNTFVNEVGMDSVRVDYFNPYTEINEDYVFVIPSYDEMTDVASQFVEYKDNLKHLQAVVGSGNRNFGEKEYCINAIEISEKYNKPLLLKFEYSGTSKDVNDFTKEVIKLEIARTKQQ